MKTHLVPHMSHFCHRRAGITLMEVLIAVGILAIGLSSVVALLPAGHSLAQRSFTTDQASIIAANAVADLVTQGFLRPECLTATVPPLGFDPLAMNPWETNTGPLALSLTQLKTPGVFATSADGVRPALLGTYLVRGRDDVVFNVPENPNQDVTNRFSADGIREYQGKFSWAALLTRPAISAISPVPDFLPGDDAVLSIIVFHQRDPSQAMVPLGKYQPGVGVLTLPSPGMPLIGGRQNRDVLRTGGVVLLEELTGPSPNYSVRRLAMASMTTDPFGKELGAFVELDGGDPPGTNFTAYLIPDAVAVLERQVVIEGPNGYVP